MQSFAVCANCNILHVSEEARIMAIVDTPRQVGLARRGMHRAQRALALMIPGRFADVMERESTTPGIGELRDRREKPLADLCGKTLSML